LILVRLEGGQVEEECRSVPPGPAVQRRGDQISHSAGRQHILGREQPVVAGQVHLPAQRHRLAQQAGAQAARYLCWDWAGEEHPGMRADPGPGDLQRRRDPH
jgi:hypothetical protein